MTNPRSSPTLRSNRVENLRGTGKRQKLKAADLADCTKPVDQDQLAVSKDDYTDYNDYIIIIWICKMVNSLVKHI